MVLLLSSAVNCFAQSPALPSLALGLSADGVRALDAELNEDLRALDAFSRRTNTGRFGKAGDYGYERPKPWMLYGRLGVVNFQNRLEPNRFDGVDISLRRTGPRLTGRFYVGIHRTF
jgi:hypothetical protein